MCDATVLPTGYLYSPARYLWYTLPVRFFSGLPNTVEIDSAVFRLKDEFHVTIINSGQYTEAVAVRPDEVSDIELRLQEMLVESLKSTPIRLTGFISDIRLAVTSERKSLAVRCALDGLDVYLDRVIREFGFPVEQPPHVSLYTETGLAVSIDSHEQMVSYTQLDLPQVLGPLKDREQALCEALAARGGPGPWWVFVQDTNGSRRFVGPPHNFRSKEAADARIAEILGGQNKAHKVDYWAVEHHGDQYSVCAAYNIEG